MWQDLTIASVIHIIHWAIFQACFFTQKIAEVLLWFQVNLCDTTLGGGEVYIVLCGSTTVGCSIPASLLDEMVALQTSEIQRYDWAVRMGGCFWEEESAEGILQGYVFRFFLYIKPNYLRHARRCRCRMHLIDVSLPVL